MKYSDQVAEWLVELGYTRCFFVAGGNIMHLLESLSRKMDCVPVVHEVAAGIAAEYYTVVGARGKALALVTAGPGLTNIVTAMAGAYLESRELLVIGGQVKTSDLARGQVRQRGIQEIDGVSIVKPITAAAVTFERPLRAAEFADLVHRGATGRKAPVFLEIPLDVQAKELCREDLPSLPLPFTAPPLAVDAQNKLREALANASRPVLLLGGGVTRLAVSKVEEDLTKLRLPVLTTWNGADRIDAGHPCYFGRPNTWGQRAANLIVQQADLVLALGTRLGLQQTGFAWEQFAINGKIVQVDCDEAELQKGHPRVDLGLCADAGEVLNFIIQHLPIVDLAWPDLCRKIEERLPWAEAANDGPSGVLTPQRFCQSLAQICSFNDSIIPCSSGGAFTVMMQTFRQKAGQNLITNKGLASMGYGLSGAIGAALATQPNRVVLVEGDGGLSQNLQEFGTVEAQRLNIKIFVFDDEGYASIRMTQRNYFKGRYVGCDRSTGLGLPDWVKLFDAYSIPCMRLDVNFETSEDFLQAFECEGPHAFIVPIDRAQTYFPKIASRVLEDGSMASNPLHLMSPPLDDETWQEVAPYLPSSR